MPSSIVDDVPADLAVIDDVDAARIVLDPSRSDVLSALQQPGSATTVAEQLGTSRQRANYHVRALERCGLLRLVEERPRRGVRERMLVATARSYILSPTLLGRQAADPARIDRLSSRYAIAVAARIVRELSTLVRRAETAGQPLASLTLDADVRFATAADRAAFTTDLSDAVNELVARYHDTTAPRGRWHRLAVFAHPTPNNPTPTDPSTTPEGAG
ncbi:MAG: helix-turn-helix domain-containing protein [Actinomycetota bacterium]